MAFTTSGRFSFKQFAKKIISGFKTHRRNNKANTTRDNIRPDTVSSTVLNRATTVNGPSALVAVQVPQVEQSTLFQSTPPPPRQDSTLRVVCRTTGATRTTTSVAPLVEVVSEYQDGGEDALPPAKRHKHRHFFDDNTRGIKRKRAAVKDSTPAAINFTPTSTTPVTTTSSPFVQYRDPGNSPSGPRAEQRDVFFEPTAPLWPSQSAVQEEYEEGTDLSNEKKVKEYFEDTDITEKDGGEMDIGKRDSEKMTCVKRNSGKYDSGFDSEADGIDYSDVPGSPVLQRLLTTTGGCNPNNPAIRMSAAPTPWSFANEDHPLSDSFYIFDYIAPTHTIANSQSPTTLGLRESIMRLLGIAPIGNSDMSSFQDTDSSSNVATESEINPSCPQRSELARLFLPLSYLGPVKQTQAANEGFMSVTQPNPLSAAAPTGETILTSAASVSAGGPPLLTSKDFAPMGGSRYAELMSYAKKAAGDRKWSVKNHREAAGMRVKVEETLLWTYDSDAESMSSSISSITSTTDGKYDGDNRTTEKRSTGREIGSSSGAERTSDNEDFDFGSSSYKTQGGSSNRAVNSSSYLGTISYIGSSSNNSMDGVSTGDDENDGFSRSFDARVRYLVDNLVDSVRIPDWSV
ncbi:MAG: hypothetical protein J3R72DRAFT_442543 [Linnemannia gamsii]|nr:MAG: hypothetical protein J3R72DRAFT_442543 [Linnemannia gamsii]